MSISDSESSRFHQAIAQGTADDSRFKDAELRCQTIVGDEDAHWLIRRVEELQRRRGAGVVRSGATRTFQFLGEDAEAVLYSETSTYMVIEMPAGSIVSKLEGTGFRTWVFRVDNGLSGSDREYFDLEYRKIATDAHMLSLKTRGFGERSHK